MRLRRGSRLQARARPAGPGRRPARPPVVRSCKRPEILKPTRFRRPGAQGRGDPLCQSFSEPRFGAREPGETRRRSPHLPPFWAAIDPPVDPQQASTEIKGRISGGSRALPGASGEQSAFEFPILPTRRAGARPALAASAATARPAAPPAARCTRRAHCRAAQHGPALCGQLGRYGVPISQRWRWIPLGLRLAASRPPLEHMGCRAAVIPRTSAAFVAAKSNLARRTTPALDFRTGFTKARPATTPEDVPP